MTTVLLILVQTLHAAPSAEYRKLAARAPTKAACEKLKTEFAPWTAPDAPAAPPDRAEAAMTALERIPRPSPADVATVRKEMESNFAAAYVQLPDVGTDCAPVRLQLARVVIKAGAKDPALRDRTSPRLRAELGKTFWESMLDAGINLVILETGVDRNFWTTPDDVGRLITELRAEYRVERKSADDLYAKDFEAAGLPGKDKSAAEVARLDALPNRDHLKAGVLREMSKAAEYFARERAIAARLRP